MLSLQGTWLLWDEQMGANRPNPPVLPALLLLDTRNLQEETLHTQNVHYRQLFSCNRTNSHHLQAAKSQI